MYRKTLTLVERMCVPLVLGGSGVSVLICMRGVAFYVVVGGFAEVYGGLGCFSLGCFGVLPRPATHCRTGSSLARTNLSPFARCTLGLSRHFY